MMILILLTREDEHNERGQNAQNKHDDREDRKDGDTLVVERALRESICFFCVRVERVSVFARFAFVSLVVLQVCVVENLREKCLSLFLSV